jgi:NADH-quinone oxidoreductase subunit H
MEPMVARTVQIILSPLLALVVGVFFLGLARKIIARIHWRYGPPLVQPVIDVIKLFCQRGVSHGRMFDLGIVLSLAGSLVVILFLPLGSLCPLSGSGGLLVILYVMLFAPLGIALSGGQGANPNISIGISRKLILSLGYEVPFLLAVLAVMTYYGTISIAEVVNEQQRGIWSIASLPLLLPAIAYFLILPAILGIRPFDMTSAPQEISSGPMVEYGGKYLALATIEHALVLFINLALFVNLFLGGAGNPATFFVKMLVVFVLGLFVHAAFPRFRIEQAIRYLWRWPTLVAFAGLIVVSIVRS